MAGSRKTKMPCIVLLLDNRQLTIPLSLKAFGQELYEAVHRDLQLVETDYFGLEFKTSDDTDHWLDKCKPIGSQTGSKSSLLFHFKVKFYPADPTALKEEYTRYLFALQLRQDLASGRLQCCAPRTAALLAAYIVQSELGDYEKVSCITEGDEASVRDSDETAYVRNIKLVGGQTVELERIIVELHRSLSGQRPSEADFNLLDAARKTDFYGVVLNQVKDGDGVPQSLAVTEAGILVFQNNQRVNVFPWAKIRKLCFRRKLFLIKLRPSADRAHPSNLVEFAFATRNRSKAFWKTCVEHHAFFCCQEAPASPAKRWPSQVLVRGSTFRYSGRTQVQLIDHVKDNLVKSRPFVRSQSFGTMASGRSCGTASLGSAARSLPLSARSGFTAAATVLTEGSIGRAPKYDAGFASTSAGTEGRGPHRDRGPDVAIAAVQPLPHKQRLAEPPSLQQDPPMSCAAAGDGKTTSPDRVTVQQSNGFNDAADVQDRYANGAGSLSSATSSSSSSAAAAESAAAATVDDFDDDAESLAKLEDAIRSLAAAELKAADAGALLTSAMVSTAGGDGAGSTASVQRRLALSGIEAERAARQQAQDEVLVACRASSLRRSLRRSSTRSTEEEMAQLEDVSDLAARVMRTDALTAAAAAVAAGGSSKAEPGQATQQLAGSGGGSGKSALLGRAQRLSSLQDLCELASKVMQCDVDLAVSAPFLASSMPSRATPPTEVAAPVVRLRGKAELSPSPPPLPVKQHAGTTDAQPVIGQSPALPLDQEAATVSVDRESGDAMLPPKGGRSIGSTSEASEAPPLPPKCNPPPAHGSLPRNFFRSDRANGATAASWKAASFHTAGVSGSSATGECSAAGGLTGSKEHVIRLPVRCRAAARAAGNGAASSSSSSSLSSSSSTSSSSSSSVSSLPHTTVRDAAVGPASSEGHRLQPTHSAELSPLLRSRGSAAIDDQLDAALTSLAAASGPPAAAAGMHAVAELPATAAPAIDSKRTCDSELQPASAASQPLRLAWHGGDGGGSAGSSYGPLSPEVDDVFVVDSSRGTLDAASGCKPFSAVLHSHPDQPSAGP